MSQVKVFIDTDMGLDVDDAVALTLAAYSQELEILGISTVIGDTSATARRVMELLEMIMGAPLKFPVAPGSPEMLQRSRDTFWDSYGDRQVLPGEPHGRPSPLQGEDLLLKVVNANPGEVVVVGIGPLTNLAKAFTKDPGVARKIKGLILMGGVFGEGDPSLPQVEYNIGSDPEAAEIVLSAGCDTLLIPLDVTTRVQLTKGQLQQLRTSNNPAGDVLSRMAELWWGLLEIQSSPMHDPLAVAAAVRPEFLKVRRGRVEVVCEGDLAGKAMFYPQADAPVGIAVDVDGKAFFEFLLGRICP